MITLANNPTKETEEKYFDTLLEQLPRDSYLQPIFSHIRPAVFQAIRNDLGWIEFNPHSLRHETAALSKQVEEKRRLLADISAAVADRRRELARIAGELETISGDAQTIARIGADRAATMRRALA